MEDERRERDRRQPKSPTFVALRPEFVKLGKLVDISSSGLSFEYIAKGDVVSPPDTLKLDMFIGANGYYLPNVPCQLVYDVIIEKKSKLMVDLEYRRCGLQFARMSQRQIDQLEYYLRHHTKSGEFEIRKTELST